MQVFCFGWPTPQYWRCYGMHEKMSNPVYKIFFGSFALSLQFAKAPTPTAFYMAWSEKSNTSVRIESSYTEGGSLSDVIHWRTSILEHAPGEELLFTDLFTCDGKCSRFTFIRIILFHCNVFQESCNFENKGHSGRILVKLESFWRSFWWSKGFIKNSLLRIDTMLGELIVNCPSLLIIYYISLSNLILQVNKVVVLLYLFSRINVCQVLLRDYSLTGITVPGGRYLFVKTLCFTRQ